MQCYFFLLSEGENKWKVIGPNWICVCVLYIAFIFIFHTLPQAALAE